VAVVPHGPPTVARAEPAAGRRRARADHYLLALGTVEPRKDLPTLVQAFDLLAGDRPDLHLVVAGPDGWGTRALDAAVAGSAHRDRIRRLGWVTEAEKAALLHGAAAFAFPSRYEGFGFPPLEAMVAGVPVVATRAGALPETLGDAAVLVPVADPAALAEGLATVLDDEERRRDLVARGARRVAELDWDRCADGLVALYHRAAGR
jgi:alpha-1,3-rhamnosyl/mannosyltransferase